MAPKNSAEWAALKGCCAASPDLARVAELLEVVHWPAFLELAEEHGVTQLVASVAQKFPPDGPQSSAKLIPFEFREVLLERQRAQAFSTMRMSAELFRLVERFAAEGIGVLAVKGPALAMQAYGDAAMRNYGDLDFLVRYTDIARATKLMMDAGYAPQIPLSAIAAGKIPGQYLFRQREAKLLVELHNDRTMRYYPRGLPIEELFSRSVRVKMDGREVPAPCVEDHLLLICIHGAKHFWEKLLWIADVAALMGRQAGLRAGLRWEEAERAARDAGGETMLHGGVLLARRVLGAFVPQEVLRRAEADSAARAMTEQVLEWLPAAGEARAEFQRGLWARALFRMRMRGGVGPGVGYFLRLLFSATEEDWDAEGGAARGVTDILKRPFRLARKHGRSGKE
jgi:hypothetical protein